MALAGANIAKLVLSSLLADDQRIAIADETSALSRRDLMASVSTAAQSLRDKGLSNDEFVIVLCNRGLRFWIDLLAVWIVGAKPICVESNLADDHAENILSMTGVRWLLHHGVECPAGLATLDVLDIDYQSCDDRAARSIYADLCFPDPDKQPEMAAIIFTSGTTGLPKGVPLSHQALISNALATSHRLRLRGSDRLLIATPFRFISSLSHFFVTLISGASFFGIERTLMIKDLFHAMNTLEITAFGGSPFHVRFIAMAGRERCETLRWIMSSGDHLPVAVIDQLEATFPGIELHVVYGMAELAGRFCELPPERLADKRGSVGVPIAGLEFSVRDEMGQACAIGDIGNIYVSGILGFQGYYANASANAKVLGPYGFENGDKGYVDKDGFLFLAGRSDSVFKRSGLKVSAQLVTDALIALDYVSDAYTTSQDDLIEGKVPVSYVVWSSDERDMPAVLSDLRKALPVNHLPRRLTTLSAIPRTGSGKVDRRKFADMLANLNERE